MKYKIGDKVVLRHKAWVNKNATIVRIQTIYGYPQYRLRFESGSEFAWINENEMDLAEPEKQRVQFT